METKFFSLHLCLLLIPPSFLCFLSCFVLMQMVFFRKIKGLSLLCAPLSPSSQHPTSSPPRSSYLLHIFPVLSRRLRVKKTRERGKKLWANSQASLSKHQTRVFNPIDVNQGSTSTLAILQVCLSSTVEGCIYSLPSLSGG